MKQELVKTALDTLNAIMIDELSSNDPARYNRVARLCGQAHQLVKMSATRVADVRQDQIPGLIGGDGMMEPPLPLDDYENGGIAFPLMGGRLNPILPRQPGDMADVLREMMMALPQFNPELNNTTEKRVDRLQALLDVRERLGGLGHGDVSMSASASPSLPRIACRTKLR